MPGFRRRSVSPEHAPDREGLPLADAGDGDADRLAALLAQRGRGEEAAIAEVRAEPGRVSCPRVKGVTPWALTSAVHGARLCPRIWPLSEVMTHYLW